MLNKLFTIEKIDFSIFFSKTNVKYNKFSSLMTDKIMKYSMYYLCDLQYDRCNVYFYSLIFTYFKKKKYLYTALEQYNFLNVLFFFEKFKMSPFSFVAKSIQSLYKSCFSKVVSTYTSIELQSYGILQFSLTSKTSQTTYLF